MPNNQQILVRFLTSFVILSCCGLAMIRGWSISQFAEARVRLASDIAKADALRAWIGVPGLTGPVLENSLAIATGDDSDEALRRGSDELGALLSARPLSSTEWLSLAAVWLESERPASEVQGALAMSWLTGPNEGSVMWRRAMFGLLHWETFPKEVHNRSIADLAGAILGHVTKGEEVSLAGHLLNQKPIETRSRIAEMLRASGLHSPELVKLGLPGEGG
jgi:hypothetical protein